MSIYSKKRTGFTLVEVLVYLGIFMAVSTAAMSLLLTFDTLIDRYKVETALYRSGTTIMEQIIVELRRADQFDAANSVIEVSDTGVLAIQNGVATTRFTKTGDDISLLKDGVEYGNINTENTSVTGFTVYRYRTAAGTFVRVHLELSATVGDFSKEIDIYGGAIIRGAL